MNLQPECTVDGVRVMRTAKTIIALLACVVALAAITAPLHASSLQKDEERLGREYAADVERKAKLITDDPAAERLERVGKALAKIANTCEVTATYGSSQVCDFGYSFKLIDDKDVNAFSLPGGHIYVNSGLMDLTTSDDELAGVLAHEIAHAAHHHMTQLLRKQSSVDRYVALVALAGILGNMRSRDLNNLMMGAQMMKVGKLSGYTMQAEKDADKTAVAYMLKSNYNPEGLLSFMRKLEEKHAENPTYPLGIFQTHPAPYRRVSSIAQAMREGGVKPNIRKLQGVAFAKIEPIAEGSDLYRVTIGDKLLYEPAALKSGSTSKERAEAIAKSANAAMDVGVTPRDIQEASDGTCLRVKDTEIFTITDEDLEGGKQAQALVDRAKDALRYAVWADWLCNDCVATRYESSDD